VNEASLRGAQVTNRADFTPTRSSFTGAASCSRACVYTAIAKDESIS